MTTLLSACELNNFLQANSDVKAIDLLLPDLSGIPRGKRVVREGADKLIHDGVRLPRSIYLLDTTGQNCHETMTYGVSDGDPDLPCFGVSSHLNAVPWSRESRAQIIGSMLNDDGTPFFADPRYVLQNAMSPLHKMGLKAVVAVELEFHLISNDLDIHNHVQPAQSASMQRRQNTTQCYGMDELYEYDHFLSDVAEACRQQNIPADTAVKEYGPGQYEINLHHCDDPLKACDDAFLLKRIIKNIARQHGFCATFMAKPFLNQPGNGMHVHCSLVDAQGNNYFAGPRDSESGYPINDFLRHAVGGLRETMAEGIAIFAPNANSYRRLMAGEYAPINRAWGVDNRTVSLRIPHCNEKSVRVEHRVAGADANPYLVMAAMLAGIHYGLVNKIDPGPMEKGDAYQNGDSKVLPRHWQDALKCFKEGSILPQYLGEKYHEAFEQNRRFECMNFHREIQPLEFQWYMHAV